MIQICPRQYSFNQLDMSRVSSLNGEDIKNAGNENIRYFVVPTA